jgi:hypothetical protein
MDTTQKDLADRLFPVLPAPEDDIELKNIPPEQRRLHTDSADLTVLSIYQYLTNAKLVIPEFQRGYVWSRTQASRLIESLVIQCPIPVVYFSQGADNVLSVIDGNQRLLSIKLFLNDAFPLQGLTTYPELIGSSWSTLDPRFRDHIHNRTIRCITILKETHPQIKFDVFERLNTGAVKLNPQELRHGVNHGSFMKRVDALTKDDNWRRAVGIRRDPRMHGAELVLRYFAFRRARQSYTKPLSSFLDQFSSAQRNMDGTELDVWTSDFKAAVQRVYRGYGKLSFRIFEPDLKTMTAFNSALYDAQMIAFAETTNPLIQSGDYDPEALQRRTAELFSDSRFSTSIRQATSDEAAVRNRIRIFEAFLADFA